VGGLPAPRAGRGGRRFAQPAGDDRFGAVGCDGEHAGEEVVRPDVEDVGGCRLAEISVQYPTATIWRPATFYCLRARDTSPARVEFGAAQGRGAPGPGDPANFADLAQKNSQDPGTARRGGDLGVFQKGSMVPAFEQALLGLKPGQISQPVKTPSAGNIIYRPTYDEVKAEIGRAAGAQVTQKAESLYISKLDSSINFKMAPGGNSLVRAVGKNREVHCQ